LRFFTRLAPGILIDPHSSTPFDSGWAGSYGARAYWLELIAAWSGVCRGPDSAHGLHALRSFNPMHDCGDFHRDPTCRFSMNPRATGNCLVSVALAAKIRIVRRAGGSRGFDFWGYLMHQLSRIDPTGQAALMT